MDVFVFQGFGVLGFHSCCLRDLRLHGGLGAPWSKAFTGRTQTAAACRFFTGFSQFSHSRVLGISSSQAWRPDP